MSLNKVMLIGNVGRDPEVRYIDAQSGQGRKVAQFTLATTERYRDRSGVMQENTEWHNIVVWGPQADVVEKYVKKGTQLYIEGRIRTRSWTDQSGNKRYTTEINADNIQLLGRRDESVAPSNAAYAGQPKPAGTPAGQNGYNPTPAPVAAAGPTNNFAADNFGDEADDLPF